MKNITKKSIKKYIAIVLVLAMSISFITPSNVQAKWGMEKSKKTFYSLDINSLDVLFVGSSVCAAAVNPYQLYEEQGINSYNLAGVAEPMNSTYFWLKEALKTQSPKVVFLEVQTAGRNTEKSEAKARKNFLWMRSGITKIQFAVDYCFTNNDVALIDYLKSFSYFEFFNSLMKKPDTSYSVLYKSVTRGYSAQTHIAGINYPGIELNTNEIDQNNFQMYYDYMERIIELCQKENIKIVLFRTPDSHWSTKNHNLIQQCSNKYGVPFVDFNTVDMFSQMNFNYALDADDDMHVNLYGSKKVSSYLANYIEQNLKLEDIRNTEKAKSFEDDLAAFNKYMKQMENEIK